MMWYHRQKTNVPLTAILGQVHQNIVYMYISEIDKSYFINQSWITCMYMYYYDNNYYEVFRRLCCIQQGS